MNVGRGLTASLDDNSLHVNSLESRSYCNKKNEAKLGGKEGMGYFMTFWWERNISMEASLLQMLDLEINCQLYTS